MDIYFISGLGADERVFQKLTLPEKFKVHPIGWPALSEKETLHSYCRKIAAGIDTSQDFILLGLSFGGIIATELTKILHPKRTIIVSGITTKNEIPLIYRICGILRLHKLVPLSFMIKIYPFTYWLFGVKDPADKFLLKHVINNTPPKFLRWAINEILRWKNVLRPHNVFHVYGTKDKLFPFRLVRADKAVKMPDI